MRAGTRFFHNFVSCGGEKLVLISAEFADSEDLIFIPKQSSIQKTDQNMENSTSITDAIWSQFGASLDMLENAINMCPEEHWETALDFWYLSYHCLFWTDYYLSTESAQFEPPKPFSFSEFDPSGMKPERTYTKTEVLDYLDYCRQKAIRLFKELTVNQMSDPWINSSKNYTLVEILLYNMRHIQHHSAQLNLLLRQTINNAPNWVSQAKKIADK